MKCCPTFFSKLRPDKTKKDGEDSSVHLNSAKMAHNYCNELHTIEDIDKMLSRVTSKAVNGNNKEKSYLLLMEAALNNRRAELLTITQICKGFSPEQTSRIIRTYSRQTETNRGIIKEEIGAIQKEITREKEETVEWDPKLEDLVDSYQGDSTIFEPPLDDHQEEYPDQGNSNSIPESQLGDHQYSGYGKQSSFLDQILASLNNRLSSLLETQTVCEIRSERGQMALNLQLQVFNLPTDSASPEDEGDIQSWIFPWRQPDNLSTFNKKIKEDWDLLPSKLNQFQIQKISDIKLLPSDQKEIIQKQVMNIHIYLFLFRKCATDSLEDINKRAKYEERPLADNYDLSKKFVQNMLNSAPEIQRTTRICFRQGDGYKSMKEADRILKDIYEATQ